MRDYTTLIICAIFILLFMVAGFVGGKDPHVPRVVGRFQTVTPNTALDTTTGELCWSYDPIGGGGKIRTCKDIK